jgi:cell wall-associated NlpC family hydrolase
MEAGHKYGVPWEVLAAINAIETDYGQNLNTSSAGAVGWMQFEPSTWAKYGVAVDGHSVPNPYDPRDAIFAAAKYLAAAGGQEDISRAVYAYNHASWYVDEVMSRAHAIATHAQYSRMTVKHGTFSVRFATGLKTTPVVQYSSGTLSHFDRLIASANMVSAADFPYLYGGGHEQPSVFAPFDCSGSVSYVIQQAGYNVPTTVSGDIPMWKFPAGPGKVTIFYNSWHTFMRIGNRYFGTSGFARPGGGAGWFDVDKLPADYLAKFSVVHVPNLGVNSFAPGENYAPLNLPEPKRTSPTLNIPASLQLSTLGSFPKA